MKLMIQDKGLRRLILKYVLTCFGVALLTICLLVPVFKTAFDNTKKIKFQDYSAQISKGFYTIGTDLQNIQTSVLFQLRENTDILNLAMEDGSSIKANQYLLNLSGYLSTANLANSSILGVVVSFRKNDYVLTHERIYDNRNSFYPYFFHYESMDYETWKNRLFFQKETFWTGETVQFLDQEAQECLTINSFYPAGSMPSVAYSVLIDNRHVKDQILIPQIGDNQFFYLMNDDKEILISHRYDAKPLASPKSQDEIELDGSRYTLVVLRDPASNLTLVSGVTNEEFTADLTAMMNTVLINILWALGVALLCSIGYAYLTQSPLKHVLTKLHSMGGDDGIQGEEESVYHYIQNALDNISEQTGALKGEFDALKKSNEWTVFNLMLHGNAVKRTVVSSVFERLEAFNGSYLLVLLQGDGLSSQAEGESELQSHFLNRFLTERLHTIFQKIYLHEDKNLCVVINVASNGGIERIIDELSRMMRILHATLPEEQIHVAVSAIHNDVYALSSAYDQAGYCLQWLRMQPDQEIGVFDLMPQKPPTVPFSRFEKLHQMLSVGDDAGVSEFFDTIYFNSGYAVNSRQTEDIFHIITMIFQSVQSNLLKTTLLTIYDYDPDVSPINLIRMQKETALTICDCINNKKRSHNSRLKEDILGFIQANYGCADLSLTMIADHFGISNRYASQFIKEQTGINYTAHLENLRMREAERLLANTSTPITDVAQMVGFDSKNTFYKAFTRKFNMSPSTYRDHTIQERRTQKEEKGHGNSSDDLS